VRRAVAFAPGRANLIGEHTDYNQGLALPFAIEQGVTVRASELDRPWIEAVAVDLEEFDSFPIEDPSAAEGWRAFTRGTVAELRRSGLRVTGARLEIAGSVPIGSGLGSSAALGVALALVLLAVSGEAEPEHLELARICSRVENEWVGARTGLLDQLASLEGSESHAVRIDFRSLDVTAVPLELGDWRLVVLDSGERHANATSGYNERRDECARACELLGVESLREATIADVERLPAPLDRRVRHVISANARVDEAVAALRRGDLVGLGALIDEGQASLRDLYEVSTPAVEEAVGRLKRAGAAGARVIGGGFGGSVLGLMPPESDEIADAMDVRPKTGARVVDVGRGRA
jgi:galactokinase